METITFDKKETFKNEWYDQTMNEHSTYQDDEFHFDNMLLFADNFYRIELKVVNNCAFTLFDV